MDNLWIIYGYDCWFQFLWKIWMSTGMIIPNIWENRNVPNHQRANYWLATTIEIAVGKMQRKLCFSTGFVAKTSRLILVILPWSQSECNLVNPHRSICQSHLLSWARRKFAGVCRECVCVYVHTTLLLWPTLLLNMVIEIASFPMNNCDCPNSYVHVYQTVCPTYMKVLPGLILGNHARSLMFIVTLRLHPFLIGKWVISPCSKRFTSLKIQAMS